MKRDFSQQFEKRKTARFYVLAEDSITHDFLLLRSADEDEEHAGYFSEEYFRAPELDLPLSEDVVRSVAKLLDLYGMTVESVRELVRTTAVDFSFIDETVGTTQDHICLHVVAHRVADRGRNPHQTYMSLTRVAELLSESSSLSRTVEAGLKLLSLTPTRKHS